MCVSSASDSVLSSQHKTHCLFESLVLRYMLESIGWFVTGYRPQRSCEGYIFTGVCLSMGGGVSGSVHAGIPPPQEQTPPGTRHPPGADTLPPPPREEQTPPWEQTPPRSTPPRNRHPLPRETATVADGTHPTGMHSCIDKEGRVYINDK